MKTLFLLLSLLVCCVGTVIGQQLDHSVLYRQSGAEVGEGNPLPVRIMYGNATINSGTMTLSGTTRTSLPQTLTSGTATVSGTFTNIKSLGLAMKTGTLYLIGSSGTASFVAGSETAAYYQSFAPDTATFTYSLLASSTGTIINTQ